MSQNLWIQYTNLQDYLKANNFVIKPSIGDGHCFLYSLIFSLSDQLDFKIDLQTIKYSILTEVSQHEDRYSLYLTNERDHIEDITNYIFKKNYNTPICDLLPHIVSNCLNVNIRILDQIDRGQSFSVHNIKSLFNSTTTVYVHKIRDHYNGIKRELTPVNHLNSRGHHRQQPRPADPQEPKTSATDTKHAVHESDSTGTDHVRHQTWPARTDHDPAITTKIPTSTETSRITYTADQLRNLNSQHHKIKRSARKEIFANRIWNPRCHINYSDSPTGICKANLIQCANPNSDFQVSTHSKNLNYLNFGLLMHAQ